jgi:hypothetical protein
VGVEFSLVHFKDGRLRLGNQKDIGDDDVIGRIRDVINARSSGDSSWKVSPCATPRWATMTKSPACM